MAKQILEEGIETFVAVSLSLCLLYLSVVERVLALPATVGGFVSTNIAAI